jgi:hypothetical protein
LVLLIIILPGCTESDWNRLLCSSKDNNIFLRIYCKVVGADQPAQQQATAGADDGPEPPKGECRFDSDCASVCEGNTLWKRGCNARTNMCEKTFDTDCAATADNIEGYSFSQVCKDAICQTDADAVKAKKTEISNQVKDLTAASQALTAMLQAANDNCITGAADMMTKLEADTANKVQLPDAKVQKSMGSATIVLIRQTAASTDSAEFISGNCRLVSLLQTDIDGISGDVKGLQNKYSGLNAYTSD